MKMPIEIIDQIQIANRGLRDGHCTLENRDDIVDHYVLNELTPDSKAAFDEHCFDCDVCFQALQARENFVALIKKEGTTIFADVIARENRPAFSLQGMFEKLLHPGLLRPAEWAFAAVAAVLVIAGATFLFKAMQPDALTSIRFDSEAPQVFRPELSAAFRAASGPGDVDFAGFYNHFLAAMSAYDNLQYRRAIERRTALAPQAAQMRSGVLNDTLAVAVRDYYFFFGATHMALARSQTQQMEEAARQTHLITAVDLLRQANAITAQNALGEANRGDYFLGLAYSFLGQKEPAVEALAKIEQGSAFYQSSQKILRHWAQ